MRSTPARRAVAVALLAFATHSCGGALTGSAGSAPRELANHMKILEECGALRGTGVGDGEPEAGDTCDEDRHVAAALRRGFASDGKPWRDIDGDLAELVAEKNQAALAQELEGARAAFLRAERQWSDSADCLTEARCPGKRQAVQLALDELVVSVRELGEKLHASRKHLDASASLRASFALRELTAFGGVVRDGIALSRVGDSGARMRLLQPEAFVDVLLLWVESVLRRLDRTVEKLDEQTHGAGSVGLALGLDEAIGRQLGDAASNVLGTYIRKVGRRRFKARLCEIVIGKPSSMANSSVASALLLRLLDDPDAGATCGGGQPRDEEKKILPIASPGTIAAARWTARLQMADSNWARMDDPKRFLEQDMPLASDIPRALDASTLLAFAQTNEQTPLDAEPALARFLLIQRAILQQPFAARSDVHGPICTYQIPADASGQPYRTTWLAPACVSLASPGAGATAAIAELARIREELACANAIRLRQAELELACLGISSNTARGLDPSAIRCTPAGFQIVLESDHLGFAATKVWPPESCGTKVGADVPDRLARRIRSITGSVGAYRVPVERIVFRGRASREVFAKDSAKSFLECVKDASANKCHGKSKIREALEWWNSTKVRAYLVNEDVTPDGLQSKVAGYLSGTEGEMDLHANDVLSLLRALHFAKSVDLDNQLCGQGANPPCVVHGMGKDPGMGSATMNHCSARAADVVLETSRDLPCKQRSQQ